MSQKIEKIEQNNGLDHMDHSDQIDDGLLNQTQFIAEEPLFENRPTFIDPAAQKLAAENAAAAAAAPKTFLQKYSLHLVIASLVVVILALLLVTAYANKQTQQPIQQQPSPTPSHTPPPDILLQRLDEANTDFKNADPTVENLPFPPVQMNISLDPQQN